MEWEKIRLELRTRLVDERVKVGILRQAVFAKEFENLMDIFIRRNIHPFDRLSDDIYDELNSACPFFSDGGHWDAGNISQHNYFYRIETMSSFLNKHTKYFNIGIDAPIALTSTKIATVSDQFDVVTKDYLKSNMGRWAPLSRLITNYNARRNFSWWTNDYHFEEHARFPQNFDGVDLTAENKWLLDFSCKVGILNDWLAPYMLFLRLDCQKMDTSNIRVPSIIDALVQPIFSPRPEHTQNRWGLAFDLNQTIQPSNREYVIKNIPIDAIDYFPIQLNVDTIDRQKPQARFSEKLLNALISNI